MKKTNGKAKALGMTLKEAAETFSITPLGLRGAIRALGIVPQQGRSKHNRMALLLTAADVKRLKAALNNEDS